MKQAYQQHSFGNTRIGFLLAAILFFCHVSLAQTQPATRPAVKPLPEGVEKLADIVYGHAGKTDLKLDLYRQINRPDEPSPVILNFHGGGWNRGSKNIIGLGGMRLVKEGYVLASVGYRLTTKAAFPAQINDAKCAVRFLRAHAKEYNIDPDRIGAMGASAGGHIAALLGTAGDATELEGEGGSEEFSSKVIAVADLWGPTNFVSIESQASANNAIVRKAARNAVRRLLGMTGSMDMDKAKAASPISYISADDPPFLIVHGEKDLTVPLAQSQEFFDALKKNSVESKLEIAPGFGHGVKGEKYEMMVLEFFNRHMNK